MKIKRCVFMIILSLIVVTVNSFSISRSNDTNPTELKSYDSINQKQWALLNTGQIIKGKKGEKGVDINILNAWDISKGSKDIIVGVIDSGIENSNNKLLKNLWKNDNAIKDGENYQGKFGWDFYNNDDSIYDKYIYDYHGTYIANIIVDISPNVTIISGKFMQGSEGDIKDAVDAIQFAIDNGAKIINCSWCSDEYDEKLFDIIKQNSNILFVVPAGNNSLNLDKHLAYPVSYGLENVISVMAIDNMGKRYEASGYGSLVDIAAPGENIYVSLPENLSTYVSGTSAAVAFVTGAVALALSINSELSPIEVKKIILSSAKKKETLKKQCKAEGYLNILNMLQQIKRENK